MNSENLCSNASINIDFKINCNFISSLKNNFELDFTITIILQMCRDQSLLVFEMKSRARRVQHAVEQLKKTCSLLEEPTVSQGVCLIAILACTDA